MKISKAFEHVTSFDQVIEVINAANEMTSEKLAGQHAYEVEVANGCAYSTTSIRLLLEFYVKHGATFDIDAALQYTVELREHFKPPMGKMMARYYALKGQRTS